MGLLDSIIGNGSGGGGLLDFLRNNAMNQQMLPAGLTSDQAQYGGGAMAQAPVFAQQNAQPSPLDTAQWPAGPMGAQSAGAPQRPPAVIQAQPLAPMAAPAPESSGGLGAGFRGFMANAGNGPIGAILGGVAGLAGMGQGSPQQQQAKINNVTAQALLQKGVDPTVVNAAVVNPELMKTLITQHFGPQTVQSLGEGHIYNPKTGKVEQAYEPSDKNKVVQIGEDGLGQKQFGIFNPSDGSIKPVGTPNGQSGGGLGDMSKTGAEYLATVPKQQQGVLQGMVDGTIQPPSSFAAAKPYWQNMLAAAKNLDPSFDANNWTARHNMSNQIAGSGNSTMGGILSNGKSSFKHLAEYTESAADLGNSSHDFPGGSAVATAQNYLGNKMFAGSDTSAKIKAINDNLGHYGQESTKFYAGTGGGVEERMNALKEMNPTTTSSEEMAAYAAKEKGLMLDRLREKEAQIRDVMGEAFLQKHPVFTPELQRDISRIDANVAKLRGKEASTAAAPALATGWAYKGSR